MFLCSTLITLKTAYNIHRFSSRHTPTITHPLTSHFLWCAICSVWFDILHVRSCSLTDSISELYCNSTLTFTAICTKFATSPRTKYSKKKKKNRMISFYFYFAVYRIPFSTNSFTFSYSTNC